MRWLAGVLLGLGLLTGPAQAQLATGSRPRAVAVAASTSGVNTGLALTVTPPPGLWVYLTGLELVACTTPVGNVISFASVSLSNLGTAPPTYLYSSPGPANTCTPWYVRHWEAPVRAIASGTAVTVTVPALPEHSVSLTIYWYGAP